MNWSDALAVVVTLLITAILLGLLYLGYHA
jgi:hypothetical protein